MGLLRQHELAAWMTFFAAEVVNGRVPDEPRFFAALVCSMLVGAALGAAPRPAAAAAGDPLVPVLLKDVKPWARQLVAVELQVGWSQPVLLRR